MPAATGPRTGGNRRSAPLVQQAASRLLEADFSVLPVFPPTHHDKPKAPAVRSWRQYQSEPMDLWDVARLFRDGCGLAVIGGKVSGNLECLDFDEPTLFQPFLEALEQIDPDLAAKLTVRVRTPSGGYHLVYRCAKPVDGNLKLAVGRDQGGKRTLIETRGEGGYFLTVPTAGYRAISGGLTDCPVITAEERRLPHVLAQSFTEEPVEAAGQPVAAAPRGQQDGRPGDEYNARWRDVLPALLERHGWKPTGRHGPGGAHWTRPGKEKGTSATLKDGWFFVFSTNAGIPTGPHSAFSVYSYLEHGGDFQAAAKALQERGFGQLGGCAEVKEETDLPLPEWPTLDRKALPGIVGEIVSMATENSEADPAAVLATFLVRFGVEVGRGPFFRVGDSIHHCRLATVIVGASSKARKGTSASPVKRLFRFAEHHDWRPATTSPGPFSSGEGIIYAVRDETETWNERTGEWRTKDPGVEDKRLFVLDEEFAGALAATKREGNTLSVILRAAWDDGTLEPLTKTSKTKATGAHIGWVSHITLTELHAKMAESEGFNGFANRILWICAKRAKIVPEPLPMPDDQVVAIQRHILDLLRRFKEPMEITFDMRAKAWWNDGLYAWLTTEHPGLAGCVINRGEAQVIRLAMLYSILEGSPVITIEALEAAVAFWDYCRRSALYIFHGREADAVAQTIIEALEGGPKTTTELHDLFKRNLTASRLGMALQELAAAGLVTAETVPAEGGKGGRPKTRYTLTKKTNFTKKSPVNSFCSFNSYGSSSKIAGQPADDDEEWSDL